MITMALILGKTGKSGSTSIVNTASMPITKVGATSSVNTTFTATTVVDGSAWNLSAVSAGMFAKTSGGWIGRVSAVNDGTDTITVDEWINIASGIKSSHGSGLPANGETVIIHQVFRCSTIKLKSDGSNIHVQRNSNATTSAFELAANESVVLFPEYGAKFVDATLINAIASSGTITLFWLTDSQ